MSWKELRKAQVFVGMRRSGKTWILYQIMQDLLLKGSNQSKMLYLNFEDDRLNGMTADNFQDILDAYFELYPQYIGHDDIYFFFDEIQEVSVWEKFIRRLLDQENMSIYITGSSSKMLSKEIATSLRGRTFTYEVFPYSFREYLKALSVDVPDFLTAKPRALLMHHLDTYLAFGGFPEAVGKSPEVHRALLQGYLDTVIYRDIVDRYHISNTHPLRLLLTHCMRNSATILSINKLYNSYKSLGYEVSKGSLYQYMDYFQDAYCVFSMNKFDLLHRKTLQSMKKVFAVDQGFIRSQSVAVDFDYAVQLETTVFAFLRRLSSDVFYYSTQKGTEVDFILVSAEKEVHAYQVSVTLKEPATKRREVDALSTAMKELSLTKGIIVTLYEEEEIVLPHGTIKVIPVLNFLLERENFVVKNISV